MREFQKNIYFCFVDYTKVFDFVDHNELWKILKEISPILGKTCMQVKKEQSELDMEQRTGSKIGKGVHQGCILSLCLFNIYAEYIMWNARLDDSQAGIKIARRNINNLRYADDTILRIPLLKPEEKLKSLLMRVKEVSEKAGLKLRIEKSKLMTPGPITSWQIEGEKVEVVTDFIFLDSKISVDGDCSHEVKRHFLKGKLWHT